MPAVPTFIGANERTAYTVEHRGPCLLITGPTPARALAALASLAPPDSIIDADAAAVLGVTFAIGPADELHKLRAGAHA
jgi:hypothetical protein